MGIEHIGADDLRRMLREQPEDLEIIDVRSRKEYDEMHIRGSRLIPAGELAQRANEIAWQKEVVFVCRSGRRSRLTAEVAAAAGIPVKNLRLGILECMKGDGAFLTTSSPPGPRASLRRPS